MLSTAAVSSDVIMYKQKTKNLDNAAGKINAEIKNSLRKYHARPPSITTHIDEFCVITNTSHSLKDAVLLTLLNLAAYGYITISGRYGQATCDSSNINSRKIRNILNNLVKNMFITEDDEYPVSPNLSARNEWNKHGRSVSVETTRYETVRKNSRNQNSA